MVFLPTEAIELLAKIVNDTIVVTRTPLQRAEQRHFSTVTPQEVWLWIAQRLDISLNVKLNIDRAYKSVRTNTSYFVLFLAHSFRL